MRLCIVATMGKSRKNFYAVRIGRTTGVFRTWEECEAQVKKYPGARFKGFHSRAEAEHFVNGGGDTRTYSGYAAVGPSTSRPSSSSSSLNIRQRYSGNLPSTRAVRTYNSPSVEDRPVVFSDGCCYKNGFRGAQAGIGVYWGEGSSSNVSEKLIGAQTNQRAELVSACRALETAIEQGHKSVEVKTDSMYTIRAVTEWIKKWKRNGWQTVNSDDVKNKEDIQRLDSLCQKIDVRWTHVPGHRGIPGNEAADRLAKAGSLK